jgi:cytolysin-activating lysine-acyltransferase
MASDDKPNQDGGGDGRVETEAPSASPAPLDRLGVLGHAIWLMSNLPSHKHLFVADLEWMLMPPVGLSQFRLYRNPKNVPVGFATWAFLDAEVEQRLMSGSTRLAPKEWNCGENVWLMDLIAPFGGQQAMLKDLKQNVFPDRRLRLVQRGPEGKGVQVAEVQLQVQHPAPPQVN